MKSSTYTPCSKLLVYKEHHNSNCLQVLKACKLGKAIRKRTAEVVVLQYPAW